MKKSLKNSNFTFHENKRKVENLREKKSSAEKKKGNVCLLKFCREKRSVDFLQKTFFDVNLGVGH